MIKLNLLGVGTNAKTIKGDGSEYLTAILYLAPADIVDGINVCPMAVLAGCKAGCLFSAGRGAFNNVQQARKRKTILFRDHRQEFLRQLNQDLTRFQAYCKRKGLKAVVRLNGTSDIRWENYIDMASYDIQFYDYTKILNRRNLPSNYHLTVSYSEASDKYAKQVLQVKQTTSTNIAVVFKDKASIPSTYKGYNVIDGDKDDVRVLDIPNSVVALYAKGQAKKNTSGFVIR